MRRKNFFFVTGPAGSGADMVAKILSRVDSVLGLGETHANLDYFLLEKLNEAQKLAWDREMDFMNHDGHLERFKKMMEDLASLEEAAHKTHVVFKRSMVNGDEYWADVQDMRTLFPEAKVIVVFRNPVGATWSAYRRKLGKSLRHCALVQEEHLTILSAQIQQIPLNDSLILSYDNFCDKPRDETMRLAEFCGLDKGEVYKAVEEERIDRRRKDAWKSELAPKHSERLWSFFSSRTPQWSTLLARSKS